VAERPHGRYRCRLELGDDRGHPGRRGRSRPGRLVPSPSSTGSRAHRAPVPSRRAPGSRGPPPSLPGGLFALCVVQNLT
jgi:hypothetical protein